MHKGLYLLCIIFSHSGSADPSMLPPWCCPLVSRCFRQARSCAYHANLQESPSQASCILRSAECARHVTLLLGFRLQVPSPAPAVVPTPSAALSAAMVPSTAPTPAPAARAPTPAPAGTTPRRCATWQRAWAGSCPRASSFRDHTCQCATWQRAWIGSGAHASAHRLRPQADSRRTPPRCAAAHCPRPPAHYWGTSMHQRLRPPALLRARKHLTVRPARSSPQAHLLWHLAPAQQA